MCYHHPNHQHHIKPCSLDFIKSVHGGMIIVLVRMRGHAKLTYFSTVGVSDQQGLLSDPHLLLQFHQLVLIFCQAREYLFLTLIALISFLFHFVPSAASQPDRAVFLRSPFMTKCCQRHRWICPCRFLIFAPQKVNVIV